MYKEKYITSDPSANSSSNEYLQKYLKEHERFSSSNYSFRTSSYVDHAKLITYEKNSLIITSGYKSRLITYGNDSWLVALGENSVLIAMALNCKFILAKGCVAAICWFDGDNTRPSIIRESEGIIKPFVPYCLDKYGFPQVYT